MGDKFCDSVCPSRKKVLILFPIMESLLNENQIEQLRQLVSQSQHTVVCCHVNPDGDAVGSVLAIVHCLRRLGQEATAIVPTPFPDFLDWMPGADDIVVYSKQVEEAKLLIEKADLFVVADLNDPSRLADMQECVMGNPAPKILIDHHLDPFDFCQLNVSHPELCATCEILCHLFWQLGEMDRLTPEEATCLYAGMMCDTGGFTYASNRPVIYECISLLLSRGIDKDKIYRNVFWTSTPNRLKLMGYMLFVKMKVLRKMNTCIMTLTNEERYRFGSKNGDTEGFVNLPLQIMGMRLSIFLNEDTEHPEVVRVSLRSVDDFPCNEMAAQFFNGGGHKNASGGRLQCTMEEAVRVAQKAIQAYSALLK